MYYAAYLKARNTSLSWEVMTMLDKATLDILSELKLDELGDIVRRQDSVPEYISMPFDQRLQFAIAELYSL